MAATNPRKNPYVGPRSFEENELFFGRERELRQVQFMLIAERIVLLYSPSGAGKSSLIQAGLIPNLRKERFRPLKIIRVNSDPPAGLRTAASFNRYLYSTLASIEEGLPEESRRAPEQLAGMSLEAYLSGLPALESDEAMLLVFDQFEEILTTDPADRAGKEEFFTQLGAALRDRGRYALFAMREDWVAALDPFLRPVPTRFANTYRLDLLGVEAALQAIQQPAEKAGAHFTDEAAGKLVDDLRRVQVQLPDGSFEAQPGQYVEPMQLQVVCYRLWENLAANDTEISIADLAEVGDVDQSLAAYYDMRVAETVAKTGVSERTVREWFERHLITEGGIRGQVPRGKERSGGLDNAAIDLLVSAHLVRSEKRGGAIWYELSHDRLIQPVHKSNQAWLEANLSFVQRQASLWDEQGRPDGMLLTGKILRDAETWEREHKSELTGPEGVFLKDSRALRSRERQRRRLTWAAIALAVLALAAFVVAMYFSGQSRTQAAKNLDLAATNAEVAKAAVTSEAKAVDQQKAAEEQKKIAEEQRTLAQQRQLAAQSRLSLSQYPQRALLLAAESVNLSMKAGKPVPPEAEEALRNALAKSSGIGLSGAKNLNPIPDSSPDGRWLVLSDGFETVQVYDMNAANPELAHSVLSSETGVVLFPSFSKDSRLMVTVRVFMTGVQPLGIAYVQVWDLTREHPFEKPAVEISGGSNPFKTIADPVISPDQHWLSINSDLRLVVYDLPELLKNPQSPPVLDHTEDGYTLKTYFVGGGRWLAEKFETSATDTNGKTLLFDLNNLQAAPEEIVQYGTSAVSEDGRFLAARNNDTGDVRLLDFANPAESPKEIQFPRDPGQGNDPKGRVQIVNNRWLLIDEKSRIDVRFIDLHNPDPKQSGFTYQFTQVNAFTMSPDGRFTAIDGKVYDLDQTANGQLVSIMDDPPSNHGYSPDSRSILEYDAARRTFALDNLYASGEKLYLDWGEGEITSQAAIQARFSPDARWVATWSGDGRVHLYDLQGPAPKTPLVLFTAEDTTNDANGELSTVVFTPGDRWLVAVGRTGTAHIWKLDDLSYRYKVNTAYLFPSLSMRDVSQPVYLGGGMDSIFTFSPDQRWVFSKETWSLASIAQGKKPPDSFDDSIKLNSPIFMAVYSPDSRWLAQWGENPDSPSHSPLYLKAVGEGENASAPRVIDTQAGNPTVMAFSPDSRWLVLAGTDALSIVDLSEANSQARILGKQDQSLAYARDIEFTPDSRSFWIIAYQGDFAERFPLPVPQGYNPGPQDVIQNVYSMSGDARWLVQRDQGKAYLWDLQARETSSSYQPLYLDDINFLPDNPTNTFFIFSPDGKKMVETGSITSENGLLWDLSTQPVSGPYDLAPGETGSVRDVVFDPNGEWILSNPRGSSPDISLFGTLQQTVSKVTSPLGKASNSIDQPGPPSSAELRDVVADLYSIKDLAEKKEIFPIPLRGHEDVIGAMLFSPDGSRIATATRNGSIRLWDLKALQTNPDAAPVVLPQETNQTLLMTLGFSPDGRWLSSSSLVNQSGDAFFSTGIQLWDLNMDALVQTACLAAGRNLSQFEWDQFFPGEEYRRTCPDLPPHPSRTPALLKSSADHIVKQEMDVGLKELHQALESSYIPNGSIHDLYRICRWGVLALKAAEVISACDLAVKGQQFLLAYQMRAAARAMTGDLAGAIEDLQALQSRQAPGEGSDWKPTWDGWLAKLQAGQNPFDAAALDWISQQKPDEPMPPG